MKAITRAHCWKRILVNGDSATIHEVTAAERINPSSLSTVLRLTLFASEIIEAILDGRQPSALQLDGLFAPFPV